MDSMTKEQTSNLNNYMFNRDMDGRRNTIECLDSLLTFMQKEGRRFTGEYVTPPNKSSRSTSGSLNNVSFGDTRRGGLFKEAARQNPPKRNRREEIPKRLAEDCTMAQEIAAVEFQNQQKELKAQEQDDTINRAVQAQLHKAQLENKKNGNDLRLQLQAAQDQIKTLQSNQRSPVQTGGKDEALALILNAINNGSQAKTGPQNTQNDPKSQQNSDTTRRYQDRDDTIHQEECRNFKRGKCTFQGCRFLHVDGQADHRPNNRTQRSGGHQRFGGHNRGQGAQGRQGDPRPKQTCFNYMDGDCPFGSRCRFAHDTPEADRRKGKGAILKAEQFKNDSPGPRAAPAGAPPNSGRING
jgi:hypothetical protein